MPLPDDAITIHGGCNCHAVRYTIRIPEISARPLHPLLITENINLNDKRACRIPFVAWDHCNDCRTATGSLLPAWLCAPAEMVTVTCVIANSTLDPSMEDVHYGESDVTVPGGRYLKTRNGNDKTDENGFTITRPGLELLTPPFIGASHSTPTWLRHYRSSKGRTRSFCGRCGTPLAYNVCPMPKPWPDMIDIVLGTVDREDLARHSEDGETGVLQPERQLWWNRGISWLRDAIWHLDGPKHEEAAPIRDIAALTG